MVRSRERLGWEREEAWQVGLHQPSKSGRESDGRKLFPKAKSQDSCMDLLQGVVREGQS